MSAAHGQILAENAKRYARLAAPYNPATGLGSLVPREAVPYVGGVDVRVPHSMLAVPFVAALADDGDFERFAAARGLAPDALAAAFTLVRIKHDYEFWARTGAVIEDKQNQIIPLAFNLPQRISSAHREAQRMEGKPIRQIELKHRQYGSTTEKIAYTFWLQNVCWGRANAYAISLEQGAGGRMLTRYGRIATNHPEAFGPVTLAGVRNAPNSQVITESGSLLSIAAVTNPQGPSGDTTQIALVSEAGKMRSGASQDAGRLMTNIMSQVPRMARTCVMIESTAEAEGQWFRRQFAKAEQGASGFSPIFISWTSDPQYTLPLSGLDDVGAWIDAWTDYDATLWENGATLEGILWHQMKRRDYDELPQMQQEFPTTPDEAFQGSDNRVFAPELVRIARKSCREPLMRGRLVGEAETGPASLVNLRFEPSPRGPLSVWKPPHEPVAGLILPDGARIEARYAAASDVGPGQSARADYSDTVILDRAPRLLGGFPELVAEWHGHDDPEAYAWQAAQLAAWYDRAFWAIEVNSLPIERDDQTPDFGLTVLDEILPVYGNLFQREIIDAATREVTKRAGWLTTHQTKALLVIALRRAWRGMAKEAKGEDAEVGFIERNALACDEADAFVRVGKAMGAAPNRKDDRIIPRGIALYLDQQIMPPPRIVLPDPGRAERLKKRARGAANPAAY